jgi:hypothetical protein
MLVWTTQTSAKILRNHEVRGRQDTSAPEESWATLRVGGLGDPGSWLA